MTWERILKKKVGDNKYLAYYEGEDYLYMSYLPISQFVDNEKLEPKIWFHSQLKRNRDRPVNLKEWLPNFLGDIGFKRMRISGLEEARQMAEKIGAKEYKVEGGYYWEV